MFWYSPSFFCKKFRVLAAANRGWLIAFSQSCPYFLIKLAFYWEEYMLVHFLFPFPTVSDRKPK